MNLDEVYKEETSYRRKQERKVKYKTIDYFDTYAESASKRNINRFNAKYYDTYENKFID